MISEKLKFSADNVNHSSLWEVACSVSYYLKQFKTEHPAVKRLGEAEKKLREYCIGDRMSVIKKPHHRKVDEAADGKAYAMAEIFLHTGFLMGIRALKETLDTEKAKTAYRLTAREPRGGYHGSNSGNSRFIGRCATKKGQKGAKHDSYSVRATETEGGLTVEARGCSTKRTFTACTTSLDRRCL
jgi:hypothetical protein